ncbi:hypothetical protein CCUS01_03863 [Colletotrichum cuscutae]|uniref:Rhodopsin domain-containing protein n=1 Tax=Colletotrichum cuscutae TaxID=1209917 RepID=A0AAI9VIF2_9PEZI|nr:hypothetical protein CCUS01_03863 [Colletotrichum cuscutae]
MDGRAPLSMVIGQLDSILRRDDKFLKEISRHTVAVFRLKGDDYTMLVVSRKRACICQWRDVALIFHLDRLCSYTRSVFITSDNEHSRDEDDLTVLICVNLDRYGTNVDLTAAQISTLSDEEFQQVAWYSYTAYLWSMKATLQRLTVLKVPKHLAWFTILSYLVTPKFHWKFGLTASYRFSDNWGPKIYWSRHFSVSLIESLRQDVEIRVPFYKKIFIAVLICSGLFVIAAAIMRVAVTLGSEPSTITVNRWGVRECEVGLIAVNAPILRPLFSRRFWQWHYRPPARPSNPMENEESLKKTHFLDHGNARDELEPLDKGEDNESRIYTNTSASTQDDHLKRKAAHSGFSCSTIELVAYTCVTKLNKVRKENRKPKRRLEKPINFAECGQGNPTSRLLESIRLHYRFSGPLASILGFQSFSDLVTSRKHPEIQRLESYNTDIFVVHFIMLFLILVSLSIPHSQARTAMGSQLNFTKNTWGSREALQHSRVQFPILLG